MKPYYTSESVTLYRAKLPRLEFVESDSLNFCITSPPYNVGKLYHGYEDHLSFQDYDTFTYRWIGEMYRVLKVSGRIGINIPIHGNSRFQPKEKGVITLLPTIVRALRDNGFILRDIIMWIKSYADTVEETEHNFGMNSTAWGSWMSPSNPYSRSLSEYIIVAHKESAKLKWKGTPDITREEFIKLSRNVWIMPPASSKTHPAPFPPELPYNFMKFYTYPGDFGIDPFVGSGTSAVVAKQIGRKLIGIDQSKTYLAQTRDRLEETYR